MRGDDEEGQLLWGRLIRGVDSSREDHLYKMKVVLGDHDRGSLPHFLSVHRHDLLGIDGEVGWVGAVQGGRVSPCSLVLAEELILLLSQQVAPLGEGVQVVVMLSATEGAFVQGDVTECGQLAHVEGELPCGLHLVLWTIRSLHSG